MKTFIYIFTFVFICGGNALSIELGSFSIRLGEILAIILFFALMPYMIKYKLNRSMRFFIYWAILSVGLICFNTILYDFEFSEMVKAFFYLARIFCLICVSYMTSIYLKKSGAVLQELKLINLCYLVVCFIGFMQLIFYPVAFDWYRVFEKIGVHWVGDPHINRLISTDFDPNYLACCLLIGIAVCMFLLKRDEKKRAWQYYLSLIIYALTILLTKSRSGILGLGIFFVVYFAMNIYFTKLTLKQVSAIFLILITGGCLLLFSNIEVFVRIRNVFSDPSALARFNSWAKGWGVMRDTHYIGLGYNLYGAYNMKFFNAADSNSVAGVDSSLQLLLITSGFIGTILFLAHLFYLFTHGKGAIKKCLIITLLVICNFNNLMFYSLWIVPFYIVSLLTSEYESVALAKRVPQLARGKLTALKYENEITDSKQRIKHD